MNLDFLDVVNKTRSRFAQGLPGQPSLPDLAATPAQVIYRRNKAQVLYYTPVTPPRFAEPVLLVPSFINRAYILDLTPGYSVAEHLRDQGFSVYLVDWGVPSDEDRLIEFDQLLEPMLDRAVRAVLRHSQHAQVLLTGYCMGGTLGIIYAALHPDRIKGLINLLGPVDFSRAGMLADWTHPAHFDPDLYIDAYGNMPATLMQTGFQLLKPLAQMSTALRKRQGHEVDADTARFFAALEHWAGDNIPFPGDAYRKYIKALYQDNLLYQGGLAIHGRVVDTQRIDCPVLTLCAEQDHIVPPACARALDELLPPGKHQITEIKGGHVAAVVGPRGRKVLWPALTHWLQEQASVLPSQEHI